jgi:hypothetical protein
MIQLPIGKIACMLTALGLFSACGAAKTDSTPTDQAAPRIANFQVKGSNGSQAPALIDRQSNRKFTMDWTIQADLPAYLYIYLTKDSKNYEDSGVTIYGGGCGGLEPCGRNQEVVCDVSDSNYVSCKMGDQSAFSARDLTPFQSADGSPSYMVMEACVLYTCVTETRAVQIK